MDYTKIQDDDYIRDGQSERLWGNSWGNYDAHYKTRIAAHNRILVLESPPEEIHARLWGSSLIPCHFP